MPTEYSSTKEMIGNLLIAYLERLSIQQLKRTTRKQCRLYLEKRLRRDLSVYKQHIKSVLVNHAAIIKQRYYTQSDAQCVPLHTMDECEADYAFEHEDAHYQDPFDHDHGFVQQPPPPPNNHHHHNHNHNNNYNHRQHHKHRRREYEHDVQDMEEDAVHHHIAHISHDRYHHHEMLERPRDETVSTEANTVIQTVNTYGDYHHEMHSNALHMTSANGISPIAKMSRKRKAYEPHLTEAVSPKRRRLSHSLSPSTHTKTPVIEIPHLVKKRHQRMMRKAKKPKMPYPQTSGLEHAHDAKDSDDIDGAESVAIERHYDVDEHGHADHVDVVGALHGESMDYHHSHMYHHHHDDYSDHDDDMHNDHNHNNNMHHVLAQQEVVHDDDLMPDFNIKHEEVEEENAMHHAIQYQAPLSHTQILNGSVNVNVLSMEDNHRHADLQHHHVDIDVHSNSNTNNSHNGNLLMNMNGNGNNNNKHHDHSNSNNAEHGIQELEELCFRDNIFVRQHLARLRELEQKHQDTVHALLEEQRRCIEKKQLKFYRKILTEELEESSLEITQSHNKKIHKLERKYKRKMGKLLKQHSVDKVALQTEYYNHIIGPIDPIRTDPHFQEQNAKQRAKNKQKNNKSNPTGSRSSSSSSSSSTSSCSSVIKTENGINMKVIHQLPPLPPQLQLPPMTFINNSGSDANTNNSNNSNNNMTNSCNHSHDNNQLVGHHQQHNRNHSYNGNMTHTRRHPRVAQIKSEYEEHGFEEKGQDEDADEEDDEEDEQQMEEKEEEQAADSDGDEDQDEDDEEAGEGDEEDEGARQEEQFQGQERDELFSDYQYEFTDLENDKCDTEVDEIPTPDPKPKVSAQAHDESNGDNQSQDLLQSHQKVHAQKKKKRKKKDKDKKKKKKHKHRKSKKRKDGKHQNQNQNHVSEAIAKEPSDENKENDENDANKNAIEKDSDGLYKCKHNDCDYSSKRRTEFVEHLLQHNSGKAVQPFVCDECGNGFPRKRSLNAHIKEAHGENQKQDAYSCTVCLRTFTSKSAMKVHYRLHSKYHPYICEFCDDGFKTYTQKMSHIKKTHETEKSV